MWLKRQRRSRPSTAAAPLRAPSPRHNGGPPLEDEKHTPPWGKGDIQRFLYWKRAHAEAWKKVSPDVMRFRMEKADRLGLTYEEYTLEILERGVHLQLEDVERIAAIKAARKGRRRRRHV
ncbi:hypothetical protein [Phreatobacter sp.]|uniref:hypothetical protein n=1 Tax=Phreatobacter sp. TaxID=1966341 RepID=UPI0022C5FADF|nr:hypothetical protein [Phreatobacter sp.]MCZ8314387.1 hypothetical protein [Phreatobacter sp.]